LVKVKICGITNLEDALFSYFSGANALGFIFYKKSPRYIDPQKVRNIARILPKKVSLVGVFVNEKASIVKKIAKLCKLDMLQFHGEESPGYCQQFKGYKVIKAFRVRTKNDLAGIAKYKTFAYLFDNFSHLSQGGSGKRFNWKILAQADTIELGKVKRGEILERLQLGCESIKTVVFLSGGLTCTNVKKAIKLLRPDWVDLSSSLELKPGKKDHQKIQKFMKAVKL
jgi:phosphoribosylanthranilate isomerase